MDDVLTEQRRYYEARAPEYDDWWFRRGRYADDAPGVKEAWFAAQAEVEGALEAFAPNGDVLELAGGTGLWTRHLTRHADSLTVVDASRAMLAHNRERVADPRVDYVEADLFTWQPSRQYDVCFFGYWLSHVPDERFTEFWQLVDAALRPGGRVFMLDSVASDPAHTAEKPSAETVVRTLGDGRRFEIVKRFYTPDELERRTAELGWHLDARVTASGHMLYATGARTEY